MVEGTHMSSSVVDTHPAGEGPLRARTLEILWHCNERNEEAERLGMQGGANLVEGITSIDYCPHTGRIVTTGGDKCIRMWQMKPNAMDRWLLNSMHDMTACCVHVCTMQPAWMPVTARWSPQGEMVATAHCDGKLCLWWRDRSGGLYRGKEAKDGQDGSSSNVKSVVPAVVPPTSETEKAGDDSAANSNVGGGQLQLEEWKNYKHLSGHMSDVYDIVFSPDSRYLISGAGDGCVMIHSLEGSAMPVVQLMDQHRKFCRGVAWDPWCRYLHTFGGGPALQCQEVIPPPKNAKGRRLHVVNQRKCQGEFMGESCSLSFRRLGWSPDGLFLAVPYGKIPRASTHHNNNNGNNGGGGSSNAGRTDKRGGGRDDADIFDLIDAKQKAEEEEEQGPRQPHAKAAKTEQPEKAGTPLATTAACEDNTTQPNKEEEVEVELAAVVGPAEAATAIVDGVDHNNEDKEEAMVHCVNIYTRDAPDRLAARLCIHGYNEIRGVLWAPCFLEPLPPVTPVPLITRVGDAVKMSSSALPGDTNEEDDGTTNAGGDDDAGMKGASSAAGARADKEEGGEQKEGSAMVLTTVAVDDKGGDGAWGPADYRMVLATWTTDCVTVYTTASPHRHSDFSDLHMRSITDVAWADNASYLLTASLDGYVSVISFGTSLAPAHRLPLFSSRPVTKAIAAMLDAFADAGREIEDGRSTRPAAPLAAGANGSERGEKQSAGAGGAGGGEEVVTAPPKPAVAVVRKKKKHAQDDVGLKELAAMMSDAPPA